MVASRRNVAAVSTDDGGVSNLLEFKRKKREKVEKVEKSHPVEEAKELEDLRLEFLEGQKVARALAVELLEGRPVSDTLVRSMACAIFWCAGGSEDRTKAVAVYRRAWATARELFEIEKFTPDTIAEVAETIAREIDVGFDIGIDVDTCLLHMRFAVGIAREAYEDGVSWQICLDVWKEFFG